MTNRREVLCRLSGLAAVAAIAVAALGFGPVSLAVVAAVAALHLYDARAGRRGDARVAVTTLRVALPVVRVRRRNGR